MAMCFIATRIPYKMSNDIHSETLLFFLSFLPIEEGVFCVVSGAVMCTTSPTPDAVLNAEHSWNSLVKSYYGVDTESFMVSLKR